MAYEINFTDATGTTGSAHTEMLPRIQALGEAHSWITKRYINTGANHELIMQGSGLSGTEQIFIGFRCYQSTPADYYNITAATFIGYLSGNTFQTQPGARLSGVPAHNNRIDYFMICNPQRIALCMRVGTPVYEHAYVGKLLPYARPGEFPFPLVNCGMLDGEAATRFSDTVHQMGYLGTRANFALRRPDGVWTTPDCNPWFNPYQAGANWQGQPSPAGYDLHPVLVHDSTPNQYGVLDGIYQITGHNNAVENVIQEGGSYTVDPIGKTVKQVVDEIVQTAGGRAYVVLQNVARTGFNDYIAMEMI